MKVYATWEDYFTEKEPNTRIKFIRNYCGFYIYGNAEMGVYQIILKGETFAVLADAAEKDVREYIKERTDGGADFYYRIEETPAVMTYNGFALIRGEYRLDGTKDVETEEVLCEGTSDDAGIDEDSEEADWNMIDEFIQNAIGYVPNYETGVY